MNNTYDRLCGFFSYVIYVIVYVICKLITMCRCKRNKIIEPIKEELPDFSTACKNGQIDLVKTYVESMDKQDDEYKFKLNQGLTDAVTCGNKDVAEYLIDSGANNLNENLKFACENNNYGMVEILIKKGASIILGLRVAKSPNIVKLLYRYRQNSEVINY